MGFHHLPDHEGLREEGVVADDDVAEAIEVARVFGHEDGLEVAAAVARDLDGELTVIA